MHSGERVGCSEKKCDETCMTDDKRVRFVFVTCRLMMDKMCICRRCQAHWQIFFIHSHNIFASVVLPQILKLDMKHISVFNFFFHSRPSGLLKNEMCGCDYEHLKVESLFCQIDGTE